MHKYLEEKSSFSLSSLSKIDKFFLKIGIQIYRVIPMSWATLGIIQPLILG